MSATTTGLARCWNGFFTQRLIQQRQVSPHTIRSYRDTFRLFLTFTHPRLHTPPGHLTFAANRCATHRAFLRSSGAGQRA